MVPVEDVSLNSGKILNNDGEVGDANPGLSPYGADDKNAPALKIFPFPPYCGTSVLGGHQMAQTTMCCQTASQAACVKGDLATLRALEQRAMITAAEQQFMFRMFLTLGLTDKKTDTIVDEQGYNNPSP